MCFAKICVFFLLNVIFENSEYTISIHFDMIFLVCTLAGERLSLFHFRQLDLSTLHVNILYFSIDKCFEPWNN